MHILYNSQLIQELMPLKSLDQKLDHFVNTSPVLRKNAEHYKAFGVSMMARLKAISSYKWNHKNNIKSHTILLRPNGVNLKADEDYGLSKVGMFYQEQGMSHIIVRHPLFNGCCYCDSCTAVLAHYFNRCGYCGSCNSCGCCAWNKCHNIFRCFLLGL